MVQVTMPNPYIKYKIISSSRSWDICYESVNGRTNGQTRWLQYSPLSMSGGIILLKVALNTITLNLTHYILFVSYWSITPLINHSILLRSRLIEETLHLYLHIHVLITYMGSWIYSEPLVFFSQEPLITRLIHIGNEQKKIWKICWTW